MFLNRPLAKKVPELTVYFWIVKVLTTARRDHIRLLRSQLQYVVVVLAALVLAVIVILQHG